VLDQNLAGLVKIGGFAPTVWPARRIAPYIYSDRGGIVDDYTFMPCEEKPFFFSSINCVWLDFDPAHLYLAVQFLK
jgi:hypothetical protein